MYNSEKETVNVLLYSCQCKICNSKYRLIYKNMVDGGISNRRICEMANRYFGDSFSEMSLGRHLKKHSKIQKKVYFKPKKENYEDIVEHCDELLAFSLQDFKMNFVRKFSDEWDRRNLSEDRLWTKDSLYAEVSDIIKSIDPSKLSHFTELYEKWFEYNKKSS